MVAAPVAPRPNATLHQREALAEGAVEEARLVRRAAPQQVVQSEQRLSGRPPVACKRNSVFHIGRVGRGLKCTFAKDFRQRFPEDDFVGLGTPLQLHAYRADAVHQRVKLGLRRQPVGRHRAGDEDALQR